jgi:hypothetical protein
MGMKLFCIVFKKLLCWKLSHETCTETGLMTMYFSRLVAPFLLLQLPRAKRRRRALSVVILLASLLSDGRLGAGKGGRPGNRRTGVYRVGRCLPSSRLCSLLIVDGGVRVCRREASPLRLSLPGDVGEAVAVAS